MRHLGVLNDAQNAAHTVNVAERVRAHGQAAAMSAKVVHVPGQSR
jgi:hypothetical protein